MITLNLPPKQVNAMLVAMDAEIENVFDGGAHYAKPEWETFPEIAALLNAYYYARCKFEENQDDGHTNIRS